MADNTVSVNELDLVIYGQVQYDFTVCGTEGCSYADSALQATYRRAVSVETEIDAISKAARRRSSLLETYSNALSKILNALAFCSGKDVGVTSKIEDVGDSDADRKAAAQKVVDAYNLLYDYNLRYDDGDSTDLKLCGDLLKSNVSDAMSLTQADLQKAQTKVKLAMDLENNGLEQTSSTLQSLISKRDSAYSMVSKIQKRVSATASSTIQAIGT